MLGSERFFKNKAVVLLFIGFLIGAAFSPFFVSAIKIGTDSSGDTWYGGYGTTITNNKGYEYNATTANIQAAIDDGGNNTVITIPAGNYNLEHTIFINYTGVTLHGVAPTEIGQGTTGLSLSGTRFIASCDLPLGMINCTTSESSRYGSGIVIENIKFVSNTAYTNTKAICINGQDDGTGHGGLHGCAIKGCTFDNIGNTAIYINYSYNSEITNCIFSNCGGDVGNNPTIYLDDEVNGLSISKCTFEADEYMSIYAATGSVPNSYICNNYFEAVSGVDNQPDEMFIGGTWNYVHITDNFFYGNHICDGFSTSGSINTVKGNQFIACNVSIKAGASSTVTSNIIIGSVSGMTYGIHSLGYNTIVGNKIDCNDAIAAIAIYIAGNGVVCCGNSIHESPFGIVVQSYAYPEGYRVNFSIHDNTMIDVDDEYVNNSESYVYNSIGKQYPCTQGGLQRGIWNLNSTYGGWVQLPNRHGLDLTIVDNPYNASLINLSRLTVYEGLIVFNDFIYIDDDETFLGYNAGTGNTGIRNTAVGATSLDASCTGVDNVAVGYGAAGATTSGQRGTFIGKHAGIANTEGGYAVLVGFEAGKSITTGNHNTALGCDALEELIDGEYNVAIGREAGGNTATDIDNCVYVGSKAGENNQGSGCVMIGYDAGSDNIVANQLYIDNSNDATPLISGNFSKGVVTINDILVLTPRALEPPSPTEGMVYVNSTSHHVYCYLNGAFVQLDN